MVAWVLQLCYTGTAYGCKGRALMLHRCSIWLHGACTYAAQGQHVAAWRLQLCCTGPPDGCTGPATMLHRASRWLHGACNSAAQGQHVACNYVARGHMAALGLHLQCTGHCIQPAIMLHRASMYLHRARTVHNCACQRKFLNPRAICTHYAPAGLHWLT